jgi:small multidrug resistance pump
MGVERVPTCIFVAMTISNISPRSGLAAVLKIAAVYNLLWGAWQVLAPSSFFHVMGMEPVNYLMIWQGLGMVIGLYGIAYYWASFNYIRHWPIVAIGLMGKVFGPIGFIYNIALGTAPYSFGYTLIPNDLIWWIPFTMMLLDAKKAGFPLR